MFRTINSPLLYYGGKRWLVDTVLPMIPKDIDEVVSPFFGGGSIELNLSLRNYRIKGYDLYTPLVNFWRYFFDDAVMLIAQAEERLKQTNKDELMSNDRLALVSQDGIDGAVWYYLYNHLSFNGCTSSTTGFLRDYLEREDGVICFVDPKNRVVFSYRKTWETLKFDNVTVTNTDFETSISANPNSFLYLDPPYPKNEKMYGEGDFGFDHEKLFEIIRDRDDWILSYDDNELTNRLYENHSKIKVKRNTRYNKFEYVIFSHNMSYNARNQTEQMTLFN